LKRIRMFRSTAAIRGLRQISCLSRTNTRIHCKRLPTSAVKPNRALLFTTSAYNKMPENLQGSEVGNDPSVIKQWDRETPMSQQIEELYKIIDGEKFCMLNTYRPNVGPVGRSMGVAKRDGPDLLFLANKNSHKFEDIKSGSEEVQVVFQDTKTQDWVSITGKASVHGNDDPRVKELYGPFLAAWFGDLGDGKHDATKDDPRIALIEVKASYIAYWKTTAGTLGFIKEVAGSAITGKVAQTGLLRELKGDDIEKARKEK
jgi:general stress protein 26